MSVLQDNRLISEDNAVQIHVEFSKNKSTDALQSWCHWGLWSRHGQWFQDKVRQCSELTRVWLIPPWGTGMVQVTS